MTGEARDAVSAYTQVNMEDASKLLQVPEAYCQEILIRIPPCQRTENETKWTILWFILQRIRSVTHWRAFFGENKCCSRMDWTKYRDENVYTFTISSVCSYQSTWFGKSRTSNPCSLPKGQEGNNATEKLDAKETREFRSGAGICQCMTEQRLDIAFSTKEIMREAAGPTTASKTKLKRIARYLKGRQRCVLNFPWVGKLDDVIHVAD